VSNRARKRAATNAAKIRAERAAREDANLLEEDASSEEDSLLWGPLPAAETFRKSGWLEKKTIDFGWNRLFVAVTLREVVFSVDENSFVCDRIVLSEIEKVVAHTSLLLSHRNGELPPRNGEAACTATRDDEGPAEMGDARGSPGKHSTLSTIFLGEDGSKRRQAISDAQSSVNILANSVLKIAEPEVQVVREKEMSKRLILQECVVRAHMKIAQKGEDLKNNCLLFFRANNTD
jgi:hypothetical protein